MKVKLLEDFQVEIDPRSADLGGGWRRDKKGRVHALGRDTLAFFDAQIPRYKMTRMLDIGASAGSYSLLAARRLDLHVLAFEPNPEVFAVLQRNIALNGLEDRVKLIPFALFDRAGPSKLKIPTIRSSSGLACLGQPKRFKKWRVVDVETRRLDDLTGILESNGFATIDLMKIDVEGAELQVLRGAERLIGRSKPKIFLEYYELNTRQFGYDPREIEKLLKFWGYREFRKFKYDLWASV